MENDQPPFSDDAPAAAEPALKRAQRPWRIALSFLTIAVVLVGLWAIITYISAAHSAQTTVTAQPPQLSGAWTTITLPAPKSQIASVLASPSDPATIFACVGSVPANFNGGPSGQYRLWRTQDSGAHWTTAATPALSGNGCDITIANDNPQRILLTLTDASPNQYLCAQIHLYLSNDAGKTWQLHRFDASTLASASQAYCDIYVTAHHLYGEYVYDIKATSSVKWHQVIRFARSDDDGATWQAADADLGTSNWLHPYPLGNDDSFVNAVILSPYDGTAPTLWATHDAGRHWTALGKSAGDTFILAPTGDNAAPPHAHPWYALKGEQVDYVIIYQTTNLKNWTQLPRLPIPGNAPNVAEALTVLTDGEIVVLGEAPQTAATPTPPALSQQTPMRTLDLWIWNPQTARWSVINAPLTFAVGCGLCPRHFTTSTKSADGKHTDTYIWIYDDNSSEADVYRLLLPHA